jgi:hypothetical protein
MARSSQGPRLTSVSASPPKQVPEPRIVRLGRPANDNGARPPLVMRLLAVVAGAALAFMALRWLEVL